MNFEKFLRASFGRTPTDDCFLSLSVNFVKFFRTPLYRVPSVNCLFHVQVAQFQPEDVVKNYFIGAFQAFYKRTRTSHSKAFIYLNSLKIVSEEVNS